MMTLKYLLGKGLEKELVCYLIIWPNGTLSDTLNRGLIVVLIAVLPE